MDEQLEIYIREYFFCIEKICVYILKELNLRNKSDLMKYRYALNKWDFYVGEIQLCFHGRGCIARYNGNFYDWDFGYGSRWCGVNPILLETTMKNNGIDYWDHKQIKEQCKNAVDEGKMYEKYGLYYFSLMETELIRPDFPKEFDTLTIEYFGEIYTIKKNKVIDRFLRKSNKIYKEIENCYDKYTLRFLLDGKEIYKFYYSDVCYPEKAVELMKSILTELVSFKMA